MGRVKVIKEYEDGSAVITLDLTIDEKEAFIAEGFLSMFKQYVTTSPTYVSREETEEICKEADVKLKKKGGKANVEL